MAYYPRPYQHYNLELSHQAAQLSNQSVEVSKVDRKQGLDLMRQARDASKQCLALIQELKRLQAA
ncbi:hypothetical protein FACHB389_26785 [Nostoc calcicola FACHB-389]|nr:hypothetical protein [Nostoc calcicola FACHB-3891]OKH29469.1 hypothetical protein FACHB389_26785 [Nostoc calcicola FACHB-389]